MVSIRKFIFSKSLGGVDSVTNEASLYWIDYLSAMSKVNYGAHGYCAHFVLSLFDREYPEPHAPAGNKGSDDPAFASLRLLSESEGVELVRKCVKELHTRFMMNQPKFTVKIIDRKGIRTIPL